MSRYIFDCLFFSDSIYIIMPFFAGFREYIQKFMNIYSTASRGGQRGSPVGKLRLRAVIISSVHHEAVFFIATPYGRVHGYHQPIALRQGSCSWGVRTSAFRIPNSEFAIAPLPEQYSLIALRKQTSSNHLEI